MKTSVTGYDKSVPVMIKDPDGVFMRLLQRTKLFLGLLGVFLWSITEILWLMTGLGGLNAWTINCVKEITVTLLIPLWCHKKMYLLYFFFILFGFVFFNQLNLRKNLELLGFTSWHCSLGFTSSCVLLQMLAEKGKEKKEHSDAKIKTT